MIHNDIQHQLQLLIKTSAPPLIEVSQSALETPEWTPGQKLPAHVLASLPNGRFEVKVGDQILDLNLPRNTQSGDTLELTYISASPRMTFALTRDLANALPPNSAVSLSDTAKFLGSLLQKGGDASQVRAPIQTAPVMSTLPQETQTLAQALRQTVSQSGLFYESHQVQWLSGQRSVHSLLAEPQGKLSPVLQQTSHAKEADTATKATATNTPVKLELGGVPELAIKPDQLQPQASHLVQQQLQTLDTRQIVWQGQIWPGQEMKWEIEEEAQRRSGEEQEASHWQTRLNLQLPTLGGVNAKLAFINGVVKIDISADEEASAGRMRDAQEALSERFAASGLTLAGLNIRHEQ